MELFMFMWQLFRQILDFRIRCVELECSHSVIYTFAVLVLWMVEKLKTRRLIFILKHPVLCFIKIVPIN